MSQLDTVLTAEVAYIYLDRILEEVVNKNRQFVVKQEGHKNVVIVSREKFEKLKEAVEKIAN